MTARPTPSTRPTAAAGAAIPRCGAATSSLPRAPGGKIDRNALRARDAAAAAASDYRAPRNEIERTLARIWKEALGVSRVGIDDNFFQLGGDSLLSIRVLARANRAGYEISSADFFAHPTVAGQAAAVAVPAEAADARGEPAAPEAAAEPFALAKLDADALKAIARQLKAADERGPEG